MIFFILLINFSPFLPHLKLSSANSFDLKQSRSCCLTMVYSITRQQILDSSKLNESADDNFKFHENSRVIQMGKKTLGKGEIARYEQFLLFPQCFQKACFPGASKGVIVWEWVKDCIHRTLQSP